MTKRVRLLILAAALAAVAILWLAAVAARKAGDSGDLTVQSTVEMTETNLNSQLAGRIKTVTVKEGDPVTKGQVLVTIDADTVRAQIDQANARVAATKAQLAASEATLNYAQTSYNRVKGLFEKGLATQAEFDDAANKLNQATAGGQAARSQADQAAGGLAEVQTYLERTSVASPATGVVTMVNVKVGELVSTGLPLLVVTDETKPWVQCSVKETDLGRVTVGQTVLVSLPAYPNQVFSGKVSRINKDADFAVRRATTANGDFDVVSFGVRVELTAPDRPLYAGMTAFVRFTP